MYKIVLMALFSLPLFAGFFPKPVYTSIQSVNKSSLTLSKKFPVAGMSGVVIHHYGKGLNAITHRVIQKDNSPDTTLLRADVIDHDTLPRIKTAVSSNDKVIGGYLYDNVLLLAPDAETYQKTTSQYAKKWIHPDLFASYLSTIGDAVPTKANLAAFAKKFQVGLIYIIQEQNAVLLDPISGKIVGEQKVSGLPKEGKFPFYMRIKPPSAGWFGESSHSKNYYKTMQSI